MGDKSEFCQVGEGLGITPAANPQQQHMRKLKVAEETKNIAAAVIFGGTRPAHTKPGQVMRKHMEIYANNCSQLASIINNLAPNEDNAKNIFAGVCAKVVADGNLHWGRIVVTCAFAACLAHHCYRDKAESKEKEEFSEYVGQWIANKCGEWILNNGGWDDFVKKFAVRDFSESMRKYLLLIGICAIILTYTAAYVYVLLQHSLVSNL